MRHCSLNTNKTEFIDFKQKEAISTLSEKPLKLVDQFTYLGSKITSTEKDFNKWNAIDRLLSILKSDKMKRDFFQSVAVSIKIHRYIT